MLCASLGAETTLVAPGTSPSPVEKLGWFDLLHAGHVDLLQRARAMGDLLIVGLNSDASVRRLKGRSRPINAEAHCAAVLAASACIDYVTIFDGEPNALLVAIRPDVLVKGDDYREADIIPP